VFSFVLSGTKRLPSYTWSLRLLAGPLVVFLCRNHSFFPSILAFFALKTADLARHSLPKDKDPFSPSYSSCRLTQTRYIANGLYNHSLQRGHRRVFLSCLHLSEWLRGSVGVLHAQGQRFDPAKQPGFFSLIYHPKIYFFIVYYCRKHSLMLKEDIFIQ